jgi:hypothetical protein
VMTRTPTDVAYRQEQMQSHMLVLSRYRRFRRSRGCSRTPRHHSNAMGPAAVTSSVAARPCSRSIFAATCTCIDTCRGQRYILLTDVQAHPTKRKGATKEQAQRSARQLRCGPQYWI